MKKTYRDLIVWQEAMELMPEVYALVAKLPKEERFELGSQLRRASVSIPANIAEGQARHHAKEFVQHLRIAKGSLAETETLLLVAVKLGQLSEAETHPVMGRLSKVGRLLNGLINKLTTDN